MRSGIYALVNTINGKRYIGSTVNMKSRWHNHRSQLRRGVHENTYLQRAWNKHGEEAFQFIVLCECSVEDLLTMEGAYIQDLAALDRAHGYNLDAILHSRKVISEETRRKLSFANKGKKRSDDTRAKISRAKQGVRASEQAKANMSTAQTGRTHTEATKAKMRGNKHSPETKAKIAAAHEGTTTSEATKAKLRDANLGKTLSQHTRDKISQANKGKVTSEATKQKMREAYYARVRKVDTSGCERCDPD